MKKNFIVLTLTIIVVSLFLISLLIITFNKDNLNTINNRRSEYQMEFLISTNLIEILGRDFFGERNFHVVNHNNIARINARFRNKFFVFFDDFNREKKVKLYNNHNVILTLNNEFNYTLINNDLVFHIYFDNFSFGDAIIRELYSRNPNIKNVGILAPFHFTNVSSIKMGMFQFAKENGITIHKINVSRHHFTRECISETIHEFNLDAIVSNIESSLFLNEINSFNLRERHFSNPVMFVGNSVIQRNAQFIHLNNNYIFYYIDYFELFRYIKIGLNNRNFFSQQEIRFRFNETDIFRFL